MLFDGAIRQLGVCFASSAVEIFRHLHREVESAALALALGLSVDRAAAALDDLLDDREAQADPGVVHIGRPLQLSELREEPRHVFLGDTGSLVPNRDVDGALDVLVRGRDSDLPSPREFE